MNPFKLKILLRGGLFLLRAYCWTRQKKNKERMVAAMLLVPAIVLLMPTYTFTLTLLQSFLFQAMLVYGIFSILWIVKHHYRLASVNFGIYLLLLIKINGPIDMGYSLSAGSEELKVMQFNVHASNNTYEETIDRVIQLNPDFISFQEVGPVWAEKLEEGLKTAFPYYTVMTHPSVSQGIAVFSKYPLIDTEHLIWHETANITGKIQVGEELVNFLALHTMSPTTRNRWNYRNAHMHAAKQFINEKEGEFLVLGDFNTVPWDKRLISFKSGTDLKDSRKKLTPTYPTWNPFVAQIPIDYIFYSKGIGCDSLNAVTITSDHKAIMGTFQIAG
ncbi:endonuclease/exonuclease/phosphatase family protein [Roseivirga sp. E12]|uniref:endonuclease/exonuclease/phosphatase family protein n=1 Tax=Roseivirga sp. E12 TaxID=2819237 RepID=UPI001ABD2A9B|nr:endonuclease/exonuclease/phosphatase family protein [Roseivirga sp. E12]MBO3698703.1 endonuclease/exonuclease/phosphatase family protein [Roseivirga sp. E12]